MKIDRKYLKERAEELRAMSAQFKKFFELEEERRKYFDDRWHTLPGEDYEQYHARVHNDPQYDIDVNNGLKWWYKNMSIFNGDKLWGMLSEEVQDLYLNSKKRFDRDIKIEKDMLINDVWRKIDASIHEFNIQCAQWSLDTYGLAVI